MTSAPLAPWVVAALALHALLAVVAPPAAERRADPPPPLEIDLATPAPAPPPALPPEDDPPATPPIPQAPAARPVAASAARASSPAARAANVLTAAPAADAPVAFVTDSNGASFGYGVVMRGGTAEQASSPSGASPAPPAPPPRAPPAPMDAPAPPSDWTRAPSLDEADPCRGFFPRRAVADAGKVTLALLIERGGQVKSASVVEETPPGDGFGEAARTCLRTKVFTPALGRDGRPVRALASVRIRFSR